MNELKLSFSQKFKTQSQVPRFVSKKLNPACNFKDTNTDKKKLACSIAAAIGISALIAGGIYLSIRKGKIKQAPKTIQNVPDPEFIVSKESKQFFNKDGIIENSAQFDNIDNLSGNQEVQNIQFNKGAKKSKTLIPNYSSSKTKRIYKDENKIHKPNIIKYYDSDKNIEKILISDSADKAQTISLFKHGGYYSMQEQKNKGGGYYMNIFNNKGMLFKYTKDSILKLTPRAKEKFSQQELQQQIQRTADNLEEAYNIIQKENIPYKTGKDGDFAHIDILNMIKQMREFIL